MFFTIIIFIIVLAVLIIVHECGHFFAARAFGIRVDEFGLGFGPRLWGKKVVSAKHGETVYTINAIPFGGFVKIFGETPDESSMSGADSARSFVNKPRWAQVVVLAAGVIANFLFAWIIISGGFLFGMPVAPDSYPQYASSIHDERITIVDVSTGSPAAKAGIVAGDTLESINIAATAHSVSAAPQTIDQIQAVVDQSGGAPLQIMYEDHGIQKEADISPVQGIVSGRYAIGIGMNNAGTLSLPLPLALLEGGRFTWHMMDETVVGFRDLVVGLFHGDRALLAQVSGPVGIASLVGEAAHVGFTYLLTLTALISINLGVINLVPFPALDGGRILFVIIEAIIRRPIKPVVANTINSVGFALLLLLMVVVTYHDIVKLF